MITQEQIDTIINEPEFNECIDSAAPHRVKIIQDISPKMKELQQDFAQEMENAEYENIKQLRDKLKLDKKDVEATVGIKQWNKKVMNLFRATLKAIHPNENQTPSVGMIYTAGKLLNYIGRDDIVKRVLEDKNITVSFKKLEDCYAYFSSKDARDVMVDIFQQADETQGEMCENADAIKDKYDLLPESVRYDPKTNKHGIKLPNFCALVRHKAMGAIKDADKYTKYINAQVENSNNAIDRENIVIGKTKQM